MAPQRNLDPFGPQKMFVIETRARREAAGLSRNKLAEALGCTPQWIGKVETFDKPPSEGLADDLDTFWQTGGTFHRMWEAMVEARKQGLIPSKFRPLTQAEREATQICLFAPVLVPGLFQTETLARLVLSAEQPRDKVEGMLAVRMERQSILTKADPPWLLLLISESVLRNIPPEVREEQCKRLLGLVDETSVAIQIIPMYARVFQSSGFQLLSFDRGPDVAYIDGASVHGQMLTDSHDVRGLNVMFSMIRTAALSAAESEKLIRTIMEGS